MLKKAEYLADREFKVGEVDEKVFSSFAEHLGRCIYSGLYEPGHPEADEQGFRKDTLKLVKELGVPMVRYPGGNFVSCFDWTDSIGPKEERPRRMDYAWASIETNEFGLDEFVDWAKKAEIEPMMAVNLGTDSIRSAGYLVEYCNHPSGTYWSDLRIKNGHKEPYNIKYWCLGNEMEGPWQAGHLSAEDYAKKALEAAKVMRWVDPSIKLIASGSSYEMLSSYLDWDRTILMELYDHIDYISTHAYYMNKNNCVGTTNYLASYKQLDTHLKATQTALDFVQAKTAKEKTVQICLDEWNVWNFSDIVFNSMSDLIGMTTFKMTSAKPWEVAPSILEEKYSLLDALVLGGLAITLLQHEHSVVIGCCGTIVVCFTVRSLMICRHFPFHVRICINCLFHKRVMSGDIIEIVSLQGHEQGVAVPIPIVAVIVVHTIGFGLTECGKTRLVIMVAVIFTHLEIMIAGESCQNMGLQIVCGRSGVEKCIVFFLLGIEMIVIIDLVAHREQKVQRREFGIYLTESVCPAGLIVFKISARANLGIAESRKSETVHRRAALEGVTGAPCSAVADAVCVRGICRKAADCHFAGILVLQSHAAGVCEGTDRMYSLFATIFISFVIIPFFAASICVL